MGKILAVCYGGGHVNTMVPVIHNLRKRGHDVTLIGLTLAKVKLDRLNIFNTPLSSVVDEEILLLGQKVYKEFHNNTEILEEESIAYYGMGYHSLIEDFGEVEAHTKLYETGRKSFFPVHGWKRILMRSEYDLVLTTSSPRFELALLWAAHELSFKSIRIEQLYYGFNLDIPSSTKIAVMDKYVQNLLVSKGIEEARISITGQPSFDNIVKHKNNLIGSSVKDKENEVLFISPGNKNYDSLLEVALKLSKNTDLKVTLKLHPNEQLHKEKVSLLNSSNVSVVSDDLYNHLLRVRFVVTGLSAVSIECLQYDCDLIIVNEEKIAIPIVNEGAAISVGSYSDVNTVIQELVQKKNLSKDLKVNREKFLLSEDSAKRVVELVEDNIKK